MSTKASSYFERRGTDPCASPTVDTRIEVDQRPREPSMAERSSAPVCVALAGFAPDRVDCMRAGYFPTWAR